LLAASYMYQRYKSLIFGESIHGAINESMKKDEL